MLGEDPVLLVPIQQIEPLPAQDLKFLVLGHVERHTVPMALRDAGVPSGFQDGGGVKVDEESAVAPLGCPEERDDPVDVLGGGADQGQAFCGLESQDHLVLEFGLGLETSVHFQPTQGGAFHQQHVHPLRGFLQ